jgi:uncharacterized protein (DUF58 family)
MALSTLDPKTVLVVVDPQRGMRFAPVVHPFAEIVSRASALAEVHADRIARIFPRFGETGTTQEVIDLLARRA